MTGTIELVRQIRAQQKHRFTPILMLTTEAHNGKRKAGKATGATNWLVKAFDPERVIQIIAKVLP